MDPVGKNPDGGGDNIAPPPPSRDGLASFPRTQSRVDDLKTIG